jgi:hypothetical protein
MAGAITLALSGSAFAIGIPTTTTQLCSDKLQNEGLLYVNSLQKQVRLSIKNNIKQVDSKCSKGFACAGGGNHLDTCDPALGNTQCSGISQCTVNSTGGIADKIGDAKAKIRSKYDQFCSTSDLLTLFGTDGSTRCPDPDTIDNGLDEDEIADCFLSAAIGDVGDAQFGDTAAEQLGRVAQEIVPDAPKVPSEVCGVTYASVLSIGSESDDATVAEAGGAAPLNLVGCLGGVCDTTGQGVIGNNLTAPTQTFAGLIAICLVTTTGNAGNGTPQDGTIDLNTGEQHSFAPISSTVMIGTTCPICDAGTGLCDSGPNAGTPCANKGGTDTACPPAGAGPVIPNPLDLSTEPHTLSVPANNPGGGATNPAATFCGSCDVDPTVGCQNDQDCIDNGVCSGILGSGCCEFGTNTGAFGDDGATTASANGLRSQYVPKLATIFCTGESGSGLVDGTQGLPGPVRLVQLQLNAYKFVTP